MLSCLVRSWSSFRYSPASLLSLEISVRMRFCSVSMALRSLLYVAMTATCLRLRVFTLLLQGFPRNKKHQHPENQLRILERHPAPVLVPRSLLSRRGVSWLRSLREVDAVELDCILTALLTGEEYGFLLNSILYVCFCEFRF
jgi:hypothetical protein